jgi:hypothetical protein
MSHEQNRDDDPLGNPLLFPACAKNDPSEVEGQLTSGNLKIGGYDLQSIMNYCNGNRLEKPILSDIDKAAVWAIYGRAPWVSTDLGNPVITIPVVQHGSTLIPKNMILTDQNNDGRFTFSLGTFATSGKSSVPATYFTDGTSVLRIPFLLTTSLSSGKRTITGIWKVEMPRDTLTNTFKDTTNSMVQLYPVVVQNP